MSLANQATAQPPSVSSSAPKRDEVFNDDLLMSEEAREYARAQFPQIFHVLDHPRLRETFAKYEKDANHARDVVRRLGFATVFFAALALLAVATQPVWLHAAWTHWPALLIELGGMLAALIAAQAMLFGPCKSCWLQSRLMTERLRQWHFQLLVRRGEQIEVSCNGPDAVARFQKERELWFNDFLFAHEDHLAAQLQRLVKEPGHIGSWLHDPPTAYSSKSATLAHVFDAYERLRFNPQIIYAGYKLRRFRKEPFWQFLKWPAICQMDVLSGMAAVCFASALACSAVLVYGHAFGLPKDVELYVRTGAVAVALIGAALHTIREGLAPDKEIERYEDYLALTSQLHDRFKQTMAAKERIHGMEEMELVSVDEMKGFLRAHHNARFVLQ